MTEKQMQFRLYEYLTYRLHHQHIIPNSKNVYEWECDIISVTRAGYAQEFEIKRTLADYRADSIKTEKHQRLELRQGHIPTRFWYVINGFDLNTKDVPEYAGLIIIDGEGIWNAINIKKKAPKLSDMALGPAPQEKLNDAAYYRMWNLIGEKHGRK